MMYSTKLFCDTETIAIKVTLYLTDRQKQEQESVHIERLGKEIYIASELSSIFGTYLDSAGGAIDILEDYV